MGNNIVHGGVGDPELVTNYNKIKVGVKTLEDAVFNLGDMVKNGNKNLANKALIMKALADNDLEVLRQVSNYFYKTSGLYQKVCNYFAFLYRYDWYVVPEVLDEGEKTADKVLKDFSKILNYLDNSHIKQLCGEIALEVIKNGAYYGYIVPSEKSLILQQLPVAYCRSRYKIGTMPAIEFNMKYFDDAFKDPAYRMRILKLFPQEFAKGYMLYKQNKLQPDYQGDVGCWYLLDPESTIKFSFYNGQYDIPIFINAIPAIIDLDQAQDLDRRKQMQKLLKILVQKLPRDKNGDLIFDVEEAEDLHNNAVQMLKRAVGVDVLTTFADVDSLDMSDKNTTTTTDDLAKVERTVYNALGISQNLFNTDGNLSLQKSIQQDESSVRNLLLQFHIFLDRIVDKKNTQKKKYNFQLYMLETTQYNYQDLSKMYKEQVQLGYSKMLPQIALGHSQSSILNTAYFENEILKLHEIMIPNLMSSTMSSEQVLGTKDQEKTPNNQNNTGSNNTATSTTKKSSGEEKKVGRAEKPDDQKAEKTIQNKESMN